MTQNLEHLKNGRHPFGAHPLLGVKAGLAHGLAEAEFVRAKKAALEAAGKLREKGFAAPFHSEEDLENGHTIFPFLIRLEVELKGIERGKEKQLRELAKNTVAHVYGLTEEEKTRLFREARLMDGPEPPTTKSKTWRKPSACNGR